MQCCICGGPLRDEDRVLRLTTYRYVATGGVNFELLRGRFQDGSEEKITHLTCPVEAGAPMSLIGADGDRDE